MLGAVRTGEHKVQLVEHADPDDDGFEHSSAVPSRQTFDAGTLRVRAFQRDNTALENDRSRTWD